MRINIKVTIIEADKWEGEGEIDLSFDWDEGLYKRDLDLSHEVSEALELARIEFIAKN